MNVEEIRRLRLAHPFRPFDLILNDGRRLPVDKPYFLAISPDRRAVMHASVDGGFEVIGPDRIRDVDFIAPVGEKPGTP